MKNEPKVTITENTAPRKTRQDIIQELKAASAGSKTYDDMLIKITTYIVTNYKLKKVVVVE